jgi:ubiquitin-protein ligase
MSKFYDILDSGSKKLRELVAPEIADTDDRLSDASSGSSWKMEDLNNPPPTNLVEISAVDSDDPISLFKVLLEEYRHILDHLPAGMVVAPAFHTLLEWHGSIHVKDGFYRGGIFKFVINIPVDYPASAPAVYFFNAVFHPLVDPVTGRLDLSIAFPTWKPGRDYIVLVLAFVKKIFFKRELNNFLVSMPRSEFESKCEDCVSESLRLVYVCHPNSPIPFSPIVQPVRDLVSPRSGMTTGRNSSVEKLEKKMTEIRANVAPEEQSERLKEWLFSTYVVGDVIDN